MRPRPAVAVLAALVPAGVLTLDPSGDSPFGPAKWLAVSVVATAGVACVLWAHRARLARWPSACWVAFLAWTALSAAFGLDRLYAWTGTPERNFGVATWVLCAATFVAGQAVGRGATGGTRLVTGAAVATAGLMGLWGLAEALGWHPVALDTDPGRLVGPLGSAAFLGGAACLLLPVAAGVALDRGWAPRLRVGAAACTALAAIALIGSGARAAWIGALAALAAGAWAGRRPLLAHRRLALAGAAAALLVLVGAAALLGVTARVGGTFDRSQAGGEGRLDEWRVAARVIARHPLTGVGPEGYRIAFPRSVDAAYERSHGRAVLPDRAHDLLLDVAVTTGLPGLLVYLGLIGSVGRFVLRALRRGGPAPVGLAAGLVAYLVQELFLFPVAAIEPAAWLLAGVLVAGVAADAETVTVRVPRLVPALAGAVAVVAAVAGIRDVTADRDTRHALAAIDRGDLIGAWSRADAAVQARPDVVRYHLAVARAEAAGHTAAADARGLVAVGDALRVSPRDPVALGQRASLLLDRANRTLALPDIANARRELLHLTAGDPVNAELRLELGVAQALSGDEAAAEKAWHLAEYLAPQSPTASLDLAAAYAASGRWADARAAAERALTRSPGNPQARAIIDRAAAEGR